MASLFRYPLVSLVALLLACSAPASHRAAPSEHLVHVQHRRAIPLPEKWQRGVYADFRGYAPGAVLTGPISPDIGANKLTPVNGPVIDGRGIGGNPAVRFTRTSGQYFRADWLASVVQAGGPFTVIVRARRANRTNVHSLWGAGHSTQSTSDYCEGNFPGGSGNSPTLTRRAIGGSAATITGADGISFDDHTLAWTYDGAGNGATYVDGVLVSSGSVGNVALTPDRFAFASGFRIIAQDFFDGWYQCLAIAPSVLSQADIATVNSTWRADDSIPTSAGPLVYTFGDSILQGGHDTDLPDVEGSYRYEFWEHCRKDGLAVHLDGGVLNFGYFPQPWTDAHSGNDVSAVNSSMTTALARPQATALKLAICVVGTNNMVSWAASSANQATIKTAYQTLLSNWYAHRAPGARLVVSTITMIDPTNPTAAPGIDAAQATAADQFNAWLPSAWDSSDATHPTEPVIRLDIHSVITDHADQADGVHPTTQGDVKIGDYVYPILRPYIQALQ